MTATTPLGEPITASPNPMLAVPNHPVDPLVGLEVHQAVEVPKPLPA